MGCKSCQERSEEMKRLARLAWDRVNVRFGWDRPYPKWMQ